MSNVSRQVQRHMRDVKERYKKVVLFVRTLYAFALIALATILGEYISYKLLDKKQLKQRLTDLERKVEELYYDYDEEY